MKFDELNLYPALLKAIREIGYASATPIQEKAIPLGLQGKDILGCAQTGTGKTAAFALPILQHIVETPSKQRSIRALVLTPTRELATQIMENFHSYGKHTKIKSFVVFGGVNQKPQEIALQKGIDILVATPGRLLDLIKQGFVTLDNVETFVLDEADRMLDMGFLPDVKRIIKQLPDKRQTMLFSATMPDDIRKLANSLLHQPTEIEVAPVSSTVDTIQQQLYYVDKANKQALLLTLLQDKKIESALVFTRTKSTANRLSKFLNANHVNAGAIHGDRSQNARQLALTNFKAGKIRILVATDIAARGIDINELSHVINFNVPVDAESYVHRIGRTGRAGRDGIAISFSNFDEIPYVKAIEKLINLKIPVVREHAYPMLILTPTPKAVRPARKKPKDQLGKDEGKQAQPPKKSKKNEKAVDNDIKENRSSKQAGSKHKKSSKWDANKKTNAKTTRPSAKASYHQQSKRRTRTKQHA